MNDALKPVVKGQGEELPDEAWRSVYVAVIVFTVITIFGLWAFSAYFSN